MPSSLPQKHLRDPRTQLLDAFAAACRKKLRRRIQRQRPRAPFGRGQRGPALYRVDLIDFAQQQVQRGGALRIAPAQQSDQLFVGRQQKP